MANTVSCASTQARTPALSAPKIAARDRSVSASGATSTRAQETILEAAQAWMIVSSLDDWIARQPTLVTKKRALLPVVVQRMQMAEGLARNLERLGLERQANRPMRA